MLEMNDLTNNQLPLREKVVTQVTLPEIPTKRYFTIGEASKLCQVKPHVLRYWEQEFTELKPVKRRGNRRYYQREDVLMIRHIRSLLYDKGFTIVGARQQLAVDKTPKAKTQSFADLGMQELIADLKNVQQLLKA